MTKAELIKALEGMPDDTIIKVISFDDGNAWVPALHVYCDEDETNDYQMEALISGEKDE